MDTKTKTIKESNDIIKFIGNGRYQIGVLLLGQLVIFVCSMQEFMLNFVALDGGWRCNINSTGCKFNVTMPSSNNVRCQLNRSEWTAVNKKTFSIVNEFNLFCQDDYWIPLSTTLFYIANMIGAPVFGIIADRYGRSPTTFLCTTIVLSTCFCAAFVPYLWLFQILRFISGFFLPGTYMVMIILTSEIVSEKYHNHIINAYMLSYFFGTALLGLVASEVRDWRLILVYSSAPYFVIIILLWFLPESFLWLLGQKKHIKLRKQMKMISNYNKTQLPTDIAFDEQNTAVSSQEDESSSLFHSKREIYQSIALMLAWWSQGLIFYGTTLVAEDLTGSIYKDFILLTLIQILALFIIAKTIDRFGRKKATISNMVSSGLCMFAIGFISPDTSNSVTSTFRLILALSSRVLSVVPYSVLIIWCAELYTTNVRSKANGIFNSSYMFGGVVAPWAGLWLQHLHHSTPFYVMGGTYALTGLGLYKVRETHRRHYPKDLPDRNSKTDAGHNNHVLDISDEKNL